LAIKSDGTLWSWGRGLYGRLGDSYYNNKSIVQYVSPLETCAIKNPYVNFNKDYIYKKYSLDQNKRTIIYYLTSNRDQVCLSTLNKIISNRNISNKYNILVVSKQFHVYQQNVQNAILKIHNQVSAKTIDFFDYEFIMNNLVYCIVGGISTAIRESLIHKIPVVSVQKGEDFLPSIKKRKPIKLNDYLKNRFGKNIKHSDQFEGIESGPNGDWLKLFDSINKTKYNFEKKRAMWFGNIELSEKIKMLK